MNPNNKGGSIPGEWAIILFSIIAGYTGLALTGLVVVTVLVIILQVLLGI